MCFGTAAAGKRAMTSSSSPGISLKQEGISYCAGAELPVVVINVMRGGPGLGNIEAAQGDYFQATKGGGHGDYRTIVLEPVPFRPPPPCKLPEKDWALTGAEDRAKRIVRSFFLPAGVLAEHCRHLQDKFALIRSREVRYDERDVEEADVALVAYGRSEERRVGKECRS